MFTAFAGGLSGVKPPEKPVTPVAGISGGANPFVPKDEKQGVGLVNSNLQNMSYTLPNGKMSTCNTIGIA